MRPLNVGPSIVDHVLMLAILPRYSQMRSSTGRGPGGGANQVPVAGGRWQGKGRLRLLSRVISALDYNHALRLSISTLLGELLIIISAQFSTRVVSKMSTEICCLSKLSVSGRLYVWQTVLSTGP
jgi:hypothetical protein